MDSPSPSGTTKLPIASLRVASGDGHERGEASIACPRKACSASVEECALCPDYAGVSIDRTRNRAFVLCREPSVEVTPVGLADDACVAQVMTRDVLCVEMDLDVESLVELLLRDGVSGVPVVDDARCPVGVISKTDLLRDRPLATTVADLMTAMAVTIPAWAPVTEAAALMARERIHRLPVVSDEGKLVGIVSAFDVMRWVARRAGTLPPIV